MRKVILLLLVMAAILFVCVNEFVSVDGQKDIVRKLIGTISENNAIIIAALISATVVISVSIITSIFTNYQQNRATRINTLFSTRENFKTQLRNANTEFAGRIFPEMIYVEGIRNPCSSYPTNLCTAAMTLKGIMKPYSRFERVLHELIDELTHKCLKLFYDHDTILFGEINCHRKRYNKLYAQYHHTFSELLRAQHKGNRHFERGASFEDYYKKTGVEMEKKGYEWEWPPIIIENPVVSKDVGVVKFYRRGKPLTDGNLKIYNEDGGIEGEVPIAEYKEGDDTVKGDISNRKMRDKREKREVGKWRWDSREKECYGTYRIEGTITVDGEVENVSLLLIILKPWKWEAVCEMLKERTKCIWNMKEIIKRGFLVDN